MLSLAFSVKFSPRSYPTQSLSPTFLFQIFEDQKWGISERILVLLRIFLKWALMNSPLWLRIIMTVMIRRHTRWFVSAMTVVIAPNPTGDLVSYSNTPMNNMAGENVLIVTKDSNWVHLTTCILKSTQIWGILALNLARNLTLRQIWQLIQIFTLALNRTSAQNVSNLFLTVPSAINRRKLNQEGSILRHFVPFVEKA